MKLRLITEAGLNRRSFLQKTGGGLLSTLVSGGLNIETTKKLASISVSPNPNLIVMFEAGEAGRYENSVRDSLDLVKKMYARAKQFAAGGPVNLANLDGQNLELCTEVSVTKIAELIKRFGVSMDDSGEDITDFYISMPGQQIRVVSNNYMSYYDSIVVDHNNLIQSWWDSWEVWGTGHMDKEMVSLLKKNGIDPSRENIEGPGYNEEPEEWEPQEPEEIIPRPDDYLASSMHQPFESRLDKALGIVMENEKPFHGYNPNKHSTKGGLNAKGRAKAKRETGSNLKPPVTDKPSTLDPDSKKAKRRKSFCARMSGVPGPTSKGGKKTAKGAALDRWNC